MYHILPMGKIIGSITAIVGTIVTVITVFYFKKTGFWDVFGTIGTTTFIVDILIFSFFNKLWIYLWKYGSFIYDFEENIFPNINGEWIGKIKHDNGILNCHAVIKQDLQNISIILKTDTSDSYTLLSYPLKRDGNKILYYIYECIPMHTSYQRYEGTTTLRIDKEDNKLIMKGHYYTTTKRDGLITLKKK